jgi:hypothetical protein
MNDKIMRLIRNDPILSTGWIKILKSGWLIFDYVIYWNSRKRLTAERGGFMPKLS